MSGFLIDTNVISELVKPRPEQRIASWVDDTDEQLMFLSVLTLGDIQKGIAFLPSNARRAALETWLDTDLLIRFEGRILAIDHAIADGWGESLAVPGPSPSLTGSLPQPLCTTTSP